MYKMDFEIGNIHKTMNVLEEEKVKIDSLSQSDKDVFKLDEKKFTKLRLRQIEKIYGDLGQEMLRLLPMNPARAIPIIYDRFRNSYDKLLDEKEGFLK